jgi:hypothetical protein
MTYPLRLSYRLAQRTHRYWKSSSSYCSSLITMCCAYRTRVMILLIVLSEVSLFLFLTIGFIVVRLEVLVSLGQPHQQAS